MSQTAIVIAKMFADPNISEDAKLLMSDHKGCLLLINEFETHTKELQEKNKELQFKLDYALNGIDPDCIDEWKKDKQELEKYKNAYKEYREETERSISMIKKAVGCDGGWDDCCKQVKELKEQTDGIMNESNTQHILGCNAYEKFCQAMSELNYDEKWIKELKEENKKLKNPDPETLCEQMDDYISNYLEEQGFEWSIEELVENFKELLKYKKCAQSEIEAVSLENEQIKEKVKDILQTEPSLASAIQNRFYEIFNDEEEEEEEED